MKKIICILSILYSHIGIAQNLVPNPSFEDTVHCPIGQGLIDEAQGWYHAGYSVDYFNPCANASGASNGVPNNWVGSQLAYDGNSYVGMVTYVVFFQQGVREHMGVQLTPTRPRLKPSPCA